MSNQRTLRPWVAALLSVLVPGLGHFYANELRRAILLYLVLQIAAALLVLLFAGAFWTFIFSSLGTLGLALFVHVNAFRRTARARVAPETRYHHVLVYLLVIAIQALAVTPILKSASLYRAYRIPTSSMRPTLEVGDYFLARKTSDGVRGLERGQIVVLEHPGNPGRLITKRIVGVEGETVEIRGRSVIVNGRVLDEPYTAHGAEGRARDSGAITVPEGAIFVLGDNRGNSEDSRHFGPVPWARVKARPLYVYFSKHPGRIGERIH